MENIEKSAVEFLKHCQYEKNLSPKTLYSYQTDLRQFIAYLSRNREVLNINKVNKVKIREYLESITLLKPKSIKRKIATIKALFNYLEYEDKISVNPFRKMKIQIKEPFRLPNVMDIKEIEKIIRAVYNAKNKHFKGEKYAYKEKLRDISVIELLFATGIRVSELSSIRKDCINLETGIVKVKGKGNKERVITVCNLETLLILKKYYEIFHIKNTKSYEYFFLNRLNKRLSEQSIRYTVKKYAALAGINRTITPHIFRHTFATLLLEQDVDIKYIQHLLGHSSIMTTQIYTHVNSERQREILSKKHPRKNIMVSHEYLAV